MRRRWIAEKEKGLIFILKKIPLVGSHEPCLKIVLVSGTSVNLILNQGLSLPAHRLGRGNGFVAMLRWFTQPTRHWLSSPNAGLQLETLGQKKLLIGLVLWEVSGSAAGWDVWATSPAQHPVPNTADLTFLFVWLLVFPLWVPFFLTWLITGVSEND